MSKNSILSYLFEPVIENSPQLAASKKLLEEVRRKNEEALRKSNVSHDVLSSADIYCRGTVSSALGEVRGKLTDLDMLSSDELHQKVEELKMSINQRLASARSK